MDPLIVAAITILGGLIAVLFVTLPVAVLMGGLYVITAMKQNQLTMRESMRTQKAIARINADSLGDGSGEMDLATLAMQFLPMLTQMKQPPQQPGDGVNENGTQTVQNPG